MHIVNIHGPGDVRRDPVAPPRCGPRDAVVRVRACGICGSDLGYIRRGGVGRPEGGVMPLGHEAAGEVTAVGEAVTGLAVGARVVINPMGGGMPIGNGGPDGALSEAVLVRDAVAGGNLLPIAGDLPYDIAAMTEPLAVALHSVNRGQARAGERAVVFGCGPVGLGIVLWLADRGVADIVAVDPRPERRRHALAMGAHAAIDGAGDVGDAIAARHGTHALFGRTVTGTELFLDAAGAPGILPQVVRIAGRHARLVVTAAHERPVELDLATMLTTEMTITTAVGYPTEMPEVLAALPRLRDRVATLISHRVAFADVLDAFPLAASGAAAKVMVMFD